MQWTYMPPKPMRHFSLRYSRTTLWRWQILQRLHNLIEHQLWWSRKEYHIYRAKSLTSPQNLRQHQPRRLGWKFGTSFNPGQAQLLSAQQFNLVRAKLKPRQKCVLQEQTNIRPKWLLLLPRLQGGGIASWKIGTTSSRQDWTSRDSRHGIIIGSLVDLSCEDRRY